MYTEQMLSIFFSHPPMRRILAFVDPRWTFSHPGHSPRAVKARSPVTYERSEQLRDG